MAALLKTTKTELQKTRDAKATERLASSKQLKDLQIQLNDAQASGGEQLAGLQQEVAGLRHQAETAQAASDRQLERLKRADETQAGLADQLQAAKRQIVSAQLDHEVELAEHEKAFKDQADQKLHTATALLRSELNKAG